MINTKMTTKIINFAQQIAIQLPSIGLYLAVGLSGVSVLFLIAGAIYTSTESWNALNNVDDE